jgi:hypothetical protein
MLPLFVLFYVNICIQSLSLGIFPSGLKYSVVTPLYKKGDKNSLAKYRPIWLLISFSKVFERVLYVRIMTHINNNNNILLKEQFGFVLNHH